jgi:dihydrofolate reductase
MPPLHAIAAMSENRVIGSGGKIPWQLPLDFRWFKHKTMGSAMIMGRKTFESIGEPLPGRTSLVLSRHGGECPGARFFTNADQLLASLPADKPAWVVGGAEIYRQFLPRCTFLYLSRVKTTAAGDVFFPEFEEKFALDQVIHENDGFRVERWWRKGTPPEPPEPWPFA